jgi:integrase
MRQRKIRVRRYTDSNRPHLCFVVNYRETGKRKRSFFETEGQAKSFAAFKNSELHRGGVESAEFPTSLRVMAQNATEKLKPFGKTLEEATNFFVDHLKASERSIAAAAYVDLLLAAKKTDGMSARYVQDLRSRLHRFARDFDGQMLATITSTQIDAWLRALPVAPRTRNHARRLLVMLFNRAIADDYATSNPAAKTGRAKEVEKAPGILTVQQTACLLEAAAPELLPYVAIGAFAGLRRAELERLDWSEIDFESGLIEVKAEKSKTAQRRFVTIQPCLREWLLPLRKHRGPVTPADFNEQFLQARDAAGIKKWPENALRHGFASYHLAHFKNAASTALELGHHDSRVTFAHYRELVKPKEGARYWNIKPEPSAKVVPLVRR